MKKISKSKSKARSTRRAITKVTASKTAARARRTPELQERAAWVALRLLLEGLIEINLVFLRHHQLLTGKHFPSIYDVLPKYKPNVFGIWRAIESVAKSGDGDACDLACWRIAELRNKGCKNVYPHLKTTYTEDGSTITQVQVLIDDMIEDPIACLGITAVTKKRATT